MIQKAEVVTHGFCFFMFLLFLSLEIYDVIQS